MPFDHFLRNVAPLLGLHGRAFRRRGIKRRLEQRMAALGLSGFEEYLRRVQEDPEEHHHLAELLTVTITRFFRDRDVFARIEASVIPSMLERNRSELNVWSIGCASGEEPYSLAMLWRERFQDRWPAIRFTLLATDIDENLLVRARIGRFKASSVREVPEDILGAAFVREGGFFTVSQAIRDRVQFKRHNILEEMPFQGMDMILCRNLAFTYFSKEQRVHILRKISESLKRRGYFCIGKDESLPLLYPTLFVPIHEPEKIYQKFG